MTNLQMSEANCPVPADLLGQLYRADPNRAAGMLDGLSENRRVELALFCYNRAHLRPLGMAIAATCEARRLAQKAGTLGEVLALQCRQKASTGPSSKISLAGTRH